MQNMNGKTALGLDNNIGALLCYINVCLPIGFVYSIIVLVTDKTNKLPRFHAAQSLILTVAATVVGFVVAIPMYVLIFASALTQSTILSLIGMLFGLVFIVYILGLLFFVVMSAIKAFNGQVYKIPVVGNFADKYSN